MEKIIRENFNNNFTGKYVVKDARDYLITNNNKFDFILLDVFKLGTFDVPKHLTTLGAIQKIYQALNSNGFFIANILTKGLFSQSKIGIKLASTINSVFSGCYYVPINEKGMIIQVNPTVQEIDEYLKNQM